MTLLVLACVIVWQLLGFISVWVIRNDLTAETRDALINVWLWPAGLVATVVWKALKRRDERQRQERISAKVASGEYDPDWARTYLKWNN